jgi:hypothetical protein
MRPAYLLGYPRAMLLTCLLACTPPTVAVPTDSDPADSTPATDDSVPVDSEDTDPPWDGDPLPWPDVDYDCADVPDSYEEPLHFDEASTPPATSTPSAWSRARSSVSPPRGAGRL